MADHTHIARESNEEYFRNYRALKSVRDGSTGLPNRACVYGSLLSLGAVEQIFFSERGPFLGLGWTYVLLLLGVALTYRGIKDWLASRKQLRELQLACSKDIP